MTPEITDEAFAYVTTTGRVTGRPHEIEIWYGLRGSTLYLLSGGGNESDWVRNLSASPEATVRIGDHVWDATARRVTDRIEDEAARRMLASKYQGWHEGEPLSDWARHALCIALDVAARKTR